MYSQSYFPNGRDISLPDNYDGTAFSENTPQSEARVQKIESVKNEIKFSPQSDEGEYTCECENEKYEECLSKSESERGGFLGIDFKGIFGSLFSGSKLSSFIPKDFGIEEILIIGIALFLLFSPERDIECALLLLALFFIK